MLTIDGSEGEGGGQVIRSALALAMATGQAVRIDHIRARRSKPGLARQHLTAVQAAARISQAELAGAQVGSSSLTFAPRSVQPGSYEFDIGTAGSTTLVAQTVLPALLTASGPTRLTIHGGTHNPLAPPFEFLELSYLPLLRALGANVQVKLESHGFFPAGGGRLVVEVEPTERLAGWELLERGPIQRRRATILLANLPRHIAEREATVLQEKLAWPPSAIETRDSVRSRGPGNVVLVELTSQHVTEVCVAFGERGIRAEQVAARVADDAQRYERADVPVGEHLADQLLLPLALAGRGAFRTLPLSGHAQTQIALIQRFLPIPITVEERNDGSVHVRIG